MGWRTGGIADPRSHASKQTDTHAPPLHACSLTELTSADKWLVVSSDGLNANEERGGGGGLE